MISLFFPIPVSGYNYVQEPDERDDIKTAHSHLADSKVSHPVNGQSITYVAGRRMVFLSGSPVEP